MSSLVLIDRDPYFSNRLNRSFIQILLQTISDCTYYYIVLAIQQSATENANLKRKAISIVCLLSLNGNSPSKSIAYIGLFQGLYVLQRHSGCRSVDMGRVLAGGSGLRAVRREESRELMLSSSHSTGHRKSAARTNIPYLHSHALEEYFSSHCRLYVNALIRQRGF